MKKGTTTNYMDVCVIKEDIESANLIDLKNKERRLHTLIPKLQEFERN